MPKPYDPERHCGNIVRRAAHSRLLQKIAEYEAAQKRIDPNNPLFAKRVELILNLQVQAEEFEKTVENCTKLKGWGTNHMGRGLCMRHCECKGEDAGHTFSVKIGPYQYADDKVVRERMGALVLSGADPMDLEPHLLFLVAVLTKSVDEKSFNTPEGMDRAVKLVDVIGKMVERINQQRLKSAVSHDAVIMLTERMGEVVKDVVTDPDLLDRILNGWRAIPPIDPNTRLRLAE